MPRWWLLVLILAACWLLALVGCHGLKLDGECVYIRKVETTYSCEPGSHIEHRRVHPVPVE